MRRVLDELKYHSEYGLILLMGISKTSDFARFYDLKGTFFQWFKLSDLKIVQRVQGTHIRRRQHWLRIRMHDDL